MGLHRIQELGYTSGYDMVGKALATAAFASVQNTLLASSLSRSAMPNEQRCLTPVPVGLAPRDEAWIEYWDPTVQGRLLNAGLPMD